jgi:hypothetical protein
MIYLGTKIYSSLQSSHEFYSDGYFYAVFDNKGDNSYMRVVTNKYQSYERVEKFEYVLPEKLNIIKYKDLEERLKVLNNILVSKIFDNL